MRNYVEMEPIMPVKELSLSALYACFAFFYSPNFRFAGESHDCWELIYLSNGEVTIETDAYETTLTKGHFFLHEPNEFHKIRANGVACNACFLSFSCDCSALYSISKRALLADRFAAELIGRVVGEGLIYFDGKNGVVSPTEGRRVEFGCGQLLVNMLETLLITLIRSTAQLPPTRTVAANISENALLQCVHDYFTEHVEQKLTLQQIAADIGYSVSHLSTVFRNATGQTLMRRFTLMKIERAKALIAEGKLNMKEIAEQLNFDSLQYFSAQFKKETQRTPTQYAAALKLNRFQADAPYLKH